MDRSGLEKIIANYFDEGDRMMAFVYAVILIEVLFAKYIVLSGEDANVITPNPMPTESKRFINLLRVIADYLDSAHNELQAEKEKMSKEMVAKVMEQIKKEMN